MIEAWQTHINVVHIRMTMRNESERCLYCSLRTGVSL